MYFGSRPPLSPLSEKDTVKKFQLLLVRILGDPSKEGLRVTGLDTV